MSKYPKRFVDGTKGFERDLNFVISTSSCQNCVLIIYKQCVGNTFENAHFFTRDSLTCTGTAKWLRNFQYSSHRGYKTYNFSFIYLLQS